MNLLLILTTQWRAQSCGYAGSAGVTTPNLDRLAAGAVNFRQAVTPHPFGPFARAALLTGIESPENGVRDYYDPLPPDAHTIADELNERGYATAFFGKWHLAKRDPNAPLVGEAHARMLVPPDQRGGFSFWEGFESGFQLNDPWLHGTRLHEPSQFHGYQSDVLCDRAASWIAEAEAEPWFCVVSLEPPHPPYDAAPAALMPPPDQVALPANVPQTGDVAVRARRELSGYYAHIAATDRAIGRLLARVNGTDTAVVFTSVHGDMHGAHGLFRKGWPYEESIRVPLLARVPGEPGAVSDETVSLTHLPTLLLSLADRETLPTSHREWARISMPSVVNLPHQCDRVWRGLRSRKRKAVYTEDGAPWLLFDLENDPLELRNLVHDPAHTEEVNVWRDRFRVSRAPWATASGR